MKFTANDIPRFTGRGDWTDSVKKGAYSVRVQVRHDDCMGEPWKEHDGHGPVSDWRALDSKAPGERVLCVDRRMALFYNFAAAVRQARKEGWDAEPYGTGTPGERAARAVEADFDRLRRYCAGEWYWLVIGTEVSYRGEVLDTDYCGGIESDGDYWREYAAERANEQIARHKRELRERRYWEARDVATVPA